MLKPVTTAKSSQLRQNHLSSRYCAYARIVLDDGGEHGRADLRVARLVALDAAHHLLEHRVAHAVGQRREPDELQVGEAGLEHEVGRDRELDRRWTPSSSSSTRWRAAIATQLLV